MNGILITNKYINNDKFSVLKDGFISSAKSLNIYLKYMDNFEAQSLIDNKESCDFILYFDKDIKLAKSLENAGYILFNNSSAISICDDKYLTYERLKNICPQPKTIFSPLIYNGDLSNDSVFIKKCEDLFSYPMIIKESHGSFGFQVYKIDKREQLVDILIKISNKEFIIQEYIDTSFGKDLRLQVIGDKVICAMLRINENNDFRANITNGAIAKKYEPNKLQKEIAINAVKAIGLDFAGVDLLFGKDNNPLLCEVNSNAHIENIGKICNINLYNEILNYIINKRG